MDLKIFTLNCWGIPVISKDLKVRIQAIAEHLSRNSYDFICLQEVWSVADFEFIKEKLVKELPYSHYFHSGVVGSGVCIFSRFPVYDVFFHQWSVNGYIHKIAHGDWFGGKGIGLCRVKVKNLSINIYSAHLHAEYDQSCDEYLAHRVLQAFDTAQFINITSGSADLVILAGDLNTEPMSLAYRILVGKANLRDCFREGNGVSTELNGTNDTHLNSYTAASLLKKKSPGKRIDYILFACKKNVNVDVTDYSLPLPNRVPGSKFSYSDHEAVYVSLKVTEAKQSDCSNKDNNEFQQVTLKEAIQICNSSLGKIRTHKLFYWFGSMFILCILITIIATNPLFNVPVVYNILVFVFTVILCFITAMASLWFRIESNAILAGKLAMEVSLQQFLEDKNI